MASPAAIAVDFRQENLSAAHANATAFSRKSSIVCSAIERYKSAAPIDKIPCSSAEQGSAIARTIQPTAFALTTLALISQRSPNSAALTWRRQTDPLDLVEPPGRRCGS